MCGGMLRGRQQEEETEEGKDINMSPMKYGPQLWTINHCPTMAEESYTAEIGVCDTDALVIWFGTGKLYSGQMSNQCE